jgi:hypothetical protein
VADFPEKDLWTSSGPSEDAELDLRTSERVDLLARRHLVQNDPNRRKRFTRGVKHSRQESIERGIDESNMNRACRRVPRETSDPGGVIGLSQGLTRFLEECPTGLCQFHMPLGSNQETGLQLGLELLDLLTEWWLGDVEPHRRATEM